MTVVNAVPEPRCHPASSPRTEAEHLWAEHGWVLGAREVWAIVLLVAGSAGLEVLFNWAGLLVPG